jgi:hypothetical protein
MMNTRKLYSERGQTLIIVTILAFVFIGMLAFVLDAGFAYYLRRVAQNAADSGALAGAREICYGEDDDAFSQARNYSFIHNPTSSEPNINVNLVDRNVEVTTYIDYQTYFARIFNIDQIPISADAKAGCFCAEEGEFVLPIAWSCRWRADGTVFGGQECEKKKITIEEAESRYRFQFYPELYVVMDSESYNEDIWCKEDETRTGGTLTCDLDGDGEIDWLSGGGRSWLDLDGSNPDNDADGSSAEGSVELRRWIVDGFPGNMVLHSWRPEQTGVSSKVFEAVEERRVFNPVVTIPIYDDFCPEGDPRYAPECQGKWHENQDKIFDVSSSPQYFHVFDFSSFYITCVRESMSKPVGSCPGIEEVVSNNSDVFLGNSYKSIEGYFVYNLGDGLSGKRECKFDSGAYTLYLDD